MAICNSCQKELPAGERVCPFCNTENVRWPEFLLISAWGIVILCVWLLRHEYPHVVGAGIVMAGCATVMVIAVSARRSKKAPTLITPGPIDGMKLGCLIVAMVVCPVVVCIFWLWLYH